MIDNKVLEIIACPVCKGRLAYSEDKRELICFFDRLAYPIEEAIPVLIKPHARSLGT